MVLGWSWVRLGQSCAARGASEGDPKSIKKIDPKLDRKSNRIRKSQNRLNILPVVVSELENTQRKSDNPIQKYNQNRFPYD